MADTDLSAWLSTGNAATALGCSTRTLERRAPEWHIEKRLRPQAGSPAVAVYNPEDVVRVAAERRQAPPPHVLPALSTSNGHGNGTRAFRNPEHEHSTALTVPPSDDPIRQLCALVIRAIQSPPSPPVAPTVSETTLYLDVEQAAAWLYWTPRKVRRAIRSGELPCRFHEQRDWRTWRIRRKDVESL